MTLIVRKINKTCSILDVIQCSGREGGREGGSFNFAKLWATVCCLRRKMAFNQKIVCNYSTTNHHKLHAWRTSNVKNKCLHFLLNTFFAPILRNKEALISRFVANYSSSIIIWPLWYFYFYFVMVSFFFLRNLFQSTILYIKGI